MFFYFIYKTGLSCLLLQDVSPPDYGAILHHLGLAASYYYSDNRRAARSVELQVFCVVHVTIWDYLLAVTVRFLPRSGERLLFIRIKITC